jgi:hypothetical protein
MNQSKQSKTKKRKSSQCSQKNKEGEKCPGKFVLDFEGTIPIFTCDTCQYKDETWKKFYEEYLQLYRSLEAWGEPKNTVSCVLGLFCYHYREFYGIDYTFVPRNPNPYGVKECRDVWTLLAMFNKNVCEVRHYITWLFDKGLSRSAQITNFGYILTPALVQKYKLQASKKSVLTRASNLPENFIEYCKVNIPDIFDLVTLGTMNDLAGLLSSVQYYKLMPDSIECRVIAVAEKMGLIKDGKLYLGAAE